MFDTIFTVLLSHDGKIGLLSIKADLDTILKLLEDNTNFEYFFKKACTTSLTLCAATKNTRLGFARLKMMNTLA